MKIKRFPFQTLAEALEAGEPPMLDKITGELNTSLSFYLVDVGGELVIVEKAYKTLSGKFVIIARYRTKEEKEAATEQIKQEKTYRKKAEQDRIKKAINLPGYILIGYKKESINSLGDSSAFYLQTTGPRYYYTKAFNFTWEKNSNDAFLRSAEFYPWRKDRMIRLGRGDLTSRIKEAPDDYTLCVPLWLLTSIPDPRPRFLAGEEKAAQDTVHNPGLFLIK